MSRTILRVPIRFERDDGTPEHAPMVLAAVGAIHARFVLDTGSDVHLLTREVAEAAGLSLAAGHDGTDHAGADVSSWLVGDVPLAMLEADDGAAPVMLRDVIAIPAPAAFVRAGIGGLLSPQRLNASAYAVLDEVGDELLLIDGGAGEVRQLLLERRPVPEVLVLARDANRDVPIVEAAVEPYPATTFLVNTGSRETELARQAAPDLAAGPGMRIGRSVSGADIVAEPAGRQVLRLAGRRIALASVMLRSDLADPAGMIGQDVLRGTVLAVGPDRDTPVLWQVQTLE